MTIEGELTVRLAWDGQRVTGAAVRSTRLFVAAKLFAGRAPAEAAAMVPRLYSICAHAQGVAAAAATEAATGGEPAAATRAARGDAAILETIQEYLWRILIDWPRAMGHAGDVDPVAAVRRLVAPVQDALGTAARRIDGNADASVGPDRHRLAAALSLLAKEHVYGETPDAWLARMDADALTAWGRQGRTTPARLVDGLLTRAPDLARSDVALMPLTLRETLTIAVLPALRRDPDFAQAPLWNGSPVETGALARMLAHPCVAAMRARHGNAVPARFAARLVELASLLGTLGGASRDEPREPWADAFSPDTGEGLAAVQTARGLLLHHVVVAGDRVTGYEIVAPTEWNFHPSGALVSGLCTLAANDEPQLVRHARLAVQALDPCVAYHVEVAHA